MNQINSKNSFLAISGILLLVFLINSCTKETETPANPYDSVNYDIDTTQDPNPDPNSIVGLHKNIFSPRCAMPGCHDGTFEPDFRTVQSTYSTLVYQPVNKYTVNETDSFEYRVIPYNVTESFLHERLTTTTSDYMPSNGNKLSSSDIACIDNWISDGARDQYGQVPAKPNNLPKVLGYIALDSTLTLRYDTIRKDGIPYNPFLVPQNKTFVILFVLEDDETPMSQLTFNKLKISTDKDDFSSATVHNAVYMNFFGFEVWQITLNSSAFTTGQDYFFRYYVNDGSHASNLEFPRNQSLFYYKSLYAFHVQ